ncbi:DUF3741 domain-containing protein/DUF4378 domain-containing protein [Heracleum sosnowskyi]|uniref:DUF3741 domain-containing protein/DUF4378 domain-containing protein n=1 Tax=Heracleum sosnowskyi TaxID=360622 RepID=A0AAD8GRS4_9APIA|nr:DUF3741 domain-containing protein/DUF4378 domain-containing protein [Heracleum sosnowskyi]
MNGIQDHKAVNIEKPFPGCLGRVVNLFDLSAGMPENRLLTDKPHGSLLSRSRSDVSGMSPVEDQIEDKATKSELQKKHGTPIKMLIVQEMSKELDSKQKPPSVVAKLMGLDSLPLQKPSIASQRSHSRGSSRSQSCVSFGSWEEHGAHQSQKQTDYKDVYEVWQSHNKYVRDKSPQQERVDGSSIEKRMALVRQNFIELKRLSADERLRQSQQFQDALEVLSSNKDSFLKFLQEPNSMFSQQLSDVQSISPPSGAKRITILRPAKIVECNKVTERGKKNEIQINEISRLGRVSSLDSSPGFSSPTACKVENSQVQATRIVVLKPSPGKSHDTKAVVSPLSSSPNASSVKDPYTGFGDDDAQESGEVAKEITRHMHENTSRHRRDETLLSSVFSNGYTGDESSFDKSEIEFAAENLSDSEALSPTSRHSWDYINRPGSPYSLSSFSRASFSPESSVGREAKKRLSERWAMMASNGSQEQKHLRRSSSTLGEMLALSDMKKSVIPEDNYVSNEQEIRRSTSCFTTDLNEDRRNAPARNILRSKSIPASSNAYVGELGSEVSDPNMDRTDTSKELTKAKSMTSLLKGRVSSFFFSRTTRSGKQKSSNSRDEIEYAELPIPSSGNDVDLRFRAAGELLESSNKASPLHTLIDEPKEGMVHTQNGFSATKPCPFIIPIENQEQPSPISVLEPPFQEDDHGEPELFDDFSKVRNGIDLPVHHVKSNLLDKCPPIGSIARTLSWDDSCTDNVSPCPIKSSAAPVGAEEERQELIFLVQTLLAAAEIGNEVQSDSCPSVESPLDPSLRDNYVGQDDKETIHATKLRHRKSVQKLVFDCVNAALVELAVCGSELRKSRARDYLQDNGSILDCLWSQMELFFGEMSFVVGEGGDRDSLVVEELVRKQVVGKDWVDHSILEIDNFRKEIEGKLLEELVQEAVEVFTGSL